MRASRVSAVLSREEQQLLFATCDLHTSSGVRAAALLRVLFETGVRPGEVCALTDSSLSPDGLRLQVVRRKGTTSQGESLRVVSLSQETARLLTEYQRTYRPQAQGEPATLFRTDAGTPFDVQTLTALVRGVGARAGGSLARLTPHLVRRTVAMRWWEEHRPSTQEGV